MFLKQATKKSPLQKKSKPDIRLQLYENIRHNYAKIRQTSNKYVTFNPTSAKIHKYVTWYKWYPVTYKHVGWS